MSAVAPPPEILSSLLLRTSTPAPDEKVLVYLERMRQSQTDIGDEEDPKTPRTKTKSQITSTSYRRRDEEPEEDIDSNVQEGERSTIGSLPANGREPGPEDGPGPKYESYGSSWGNFGPLPPDSLNGEGTPMRAAGVALPPSGPSTKVRSSRAGSRASASQHPRTRASEVNEEPAVTAAGDLLMSPRSKTRTANGDRPLSPRSHASRATPQPRVSEKASSTIYPPLPPSQSGAHSNVGSSANKPMSNLSYHKTRSIAPSLSPSDSPSQYKPPKVKKEPTLKPVQSVEGSEIERASRHTRSRSGQNGELRSQHGASAMSGGRNGANGSQRPFSPYRHAPTSQDLLQAAIRGHSVASNGDVVSNGRGHGSTTSTAKRSAVARDVDHTPTQSRPQSPNDEMNELNADERQIIDDVLSRGAHSHVHHRASRTSYAATSVLEPEMVSHFHDVDLCILLQQLEDPKQHDVVKKAVKKALKTRVKKLGMKYDTETIKEYRKSFHDHDPSVHLQPGYQPNFPQEPPDWAKELMQNMVIMQQRLEGLGPKIDSLRSQSGSIQDSQRQYQPQYGTEYDGDGTPMTQTVNIQTQMTGITGDESMYQHADPDMQIVESTHGQTLPGSMHRHDGSDHGLGEEEEYDDEDQTHRGMPMYHGVGTDADTRTHGLSEYDNMNNRDSPGQQYLEEELYKLRVRPGGSQSAVSHKTWELARGDGEDEDEFNDNQVAVTESGMPEIPDSNVGYQRAQSPPLPALPSDQGSRREPSGQVWQPNNYTDEPPLPPPWQRIHQRLLNWAIVWPLTELETALNSTTRGAQVDEVALSIWSTQTYKRYVRSKMTDSPPGRVDRLFVPPNMADAISNAVFNGRHGDASGMLRELWHPFGLEGMPRLLIVLAKHRSDANHWVVHRFSLPDGTLTTYDSYPERCLPDGRVSSPESVSRPHPPSDFDPDPPPYIDTYDPYALNSYYPDALSNPVWSQPLGWWFAIRIAWPNAIYPSPDHLMQKMVRLHRPMQLGIDNSVAAAGIWRNLLMGSRAERSLDLERLRDLINTEVKNLRQRKLMGKLSIGAPRPNWEDMN